MPRATDSSFLDEKISFEVPSDTVARTADVHPGDEMPQVGLD